MPKPPGKCIYCGGGNLSKEHLWPDWLREFIPRVEGASTVHYSFKARNADGQIDFSKPQKGKLSRPGDPFSQRLRIVCQSCNSGWCSRLQQSAKPIIAKFFDLPVNLFLSEHDAIVFARWVAMYCAVREFRDGADTKISQAQRTQMMSENAPSKQFSVFIAQIDSPEWEARVWINPYGGFYFDDDNVAHPITGQDTTFKLGNVLIHCSSTTSPNPVDYSGILQEYPMVCLWPYHPYVPRVYRLFKEADAWGVAHWRRRENFLLNG